MNGVVLEEIDKVVQIHEGFVDSHNAGLGGVLSEGRSEGESSNSSESVDSESNVGHGLFECVLG